MQKDTFLIVDGNSLMHRAYHALPLMDADGIYTGDSGENYKGLQKPLRLASYLAAKRWELDWDASCAYGDSASDWPMLALTAHPTLVNPAGKVRKLHPDAACVRWRKTKGR